MLTLFGLEIPIVGGVYLMLALTCAMFCAILLGMGMPTVPGLCECRLAARAAAGQSGGQFLYREHVRVLFCGGLGDHAARGRGGLCRGLDHRRRADAHRLCGRARGDCDVHDQPMVTVMPYESNIRPR